VARLPPWWLCVRQLWCRLMAASTLQPVGLALRRWRLLHRVKQAHAAEMFNVTQSTISRWEAGTITPDPAQCRRLWSVLSARLDAAADRALGMLVSESPRPMHLICNATHTMLAASPSRKSEFGEQELIGRSLWPFATVEIATAEVEIREAGLLVLELDTGDNGSLAVRIRPGRCRWTWMMLSDGSATRLVETLPFSQAHQSTRATP
jgi:transcriptional regulator with XRE-family HTH domain